MAWNGSDLREVEREGRGREGGGKYHHSTRDTQRSPLRHGLLAGAIVVALGCAGVWWFVGRGGGQGADRPTDIGKHGTIAEVKPQIATNRSTEVVENVPVEKPETYAPAEKSGWTMIGNKRGKMLSCETNANGAVISMWMLENGRKMKNVAPPNLFDNTADQVLAMLLTAEEGADLPPLPDLGDLDVEFFKATLKPIEIADSDSDDVKRIKDRVIQGREDMLDLMKQGKSFADIARDHHELVTGNIEIRNECIRNMQKFVQEGDVENAVKYREKVNETLKGMGIDEINMPLTDAEKEAAENEYEEYENENE